MESVLKIKLDVSPEIERILDGQSKICNWLYNQLVQTANDLRTKYRKTQDPLVAQTLYTKYGLRNLIPGLKKQFPFLKSVHSEPLKNAALRLTSAIKDYQDSKRGRSQKKQCGWPKFRSWGKKWFSMKYTEPFVGYKLKESLLKLSLGKDEKGKQIRVSIRLA
ncbi:MAG: transposase, partial [Planctomycetota bacterium]